MSVGEALLTLLRKRVGDGLFYAAPPRQLGGGFHTENLAFSLAGAPSGWDGPLVLRLVPGDGLPGLAGREAVVQNTLAAQGFPAARVLLWDDDAESLGRSFLIMELLPGRVLLGDLNAAQFLRSAGSILRMPRVLAETQARLHRLDATPLVDALGERAAGVDGWLDFIEAYVEERAPELGDGVRWLVDHRPPAPARRVICHGDLWFGNMLGDRGRVVGVLDWTLATVAEPAFDVGFTALSLTIAPIELPKPAVALALRGGAVVTRRFVATYERLTGADLSALPWYEALRCILELTEVIDYRRAKLEGRTRETPRPTWDVATDHMFEYFLARTGVTLPLPPPV